MSEQTISPMVASQRDQGDTNGQMVTLAHKTRPRYRQLRVHLPEPLYFRLKQLAVLERKPARYYVIAGLRRVLREDNPLPVTPGPARRLDTPFHEIHEEIPESIYVTLKQRSLLEHIPLRFYVITGLRYVMGNYPSARDALASIRFMTAPALPEPVK